MFGQGDQNEGQEIELMDDVAEENNSMSESKLKKLTSTFENSHSTSNQLGRSESSQLPASEFPGELERFRTNLAVPSRRHNQGVPRVDSQTQAMNQMNQSYPSRPAAEEATCMYNSVYKRDSKNTLTSHNQRAIQSKIIQQENSSNNTIRETRESIGGE